jgi:predicted ArsR family transcriptional regulator
MSGNGVTKGAVLSYLIQEADLDGLATISLREVGEALGIEMSGVCYHLSTLEEAGLVEYAGRTSGIKGHSISAYQLSDEVLDS